MDTNTKRIFKRIVVALVYILLIGGLVLLISFLREPAAPSCFDNVKNQNETGIDCGGGCKPCEQLQNLSVFEVKFFPSREGFVDVFSEVKNSNVPYGVATFEYVFELFDRDNNLVGSRGGTSFVLPNSTKFIAEQAIPIDRTVARVSFNFSPPQFDVVQNYIAPRLSPLSVRSERLPEGKAGFLEVRGNIVNQANFDFDIVNVVVLLKDETGQAVAVNSHDIRTLVANENRFFAVRWPYRVPHFTRIEVFPDTNIFEDSNYLRFLNE